MMRLRLIVANPLAATIIPPFGLRAKDASTRSKSFGMRALTERVHAEPYVAAHDELVLPLEHVD